MTHGQDPAPARPAWAAEILVTPDLAAELIAGQFPDLAGAAVVPLATGWDNTVYRVGGEWLFRFPRREIAVPGVRREIAVLPRLAPRLPLPIPDPRFIGQPTDRYRWPFFGARLVPGTELAACGLPEDARTAAAAGTGRFLRALHDPALAALTADAGLPVDPMSRASPGVRARMARPVLERLARGGTWKPDPDVVALLDEADRAGDVPGPGPLVVCHGDLHVRHLLVGPDGAADRGDRLGRPVPRRPRGGPGHRLPGVRRPGEGRPAGRLRRAGHRRAGTGRPHPGRLAGRGAGRVRGRRRAPRLAGRVPGRPAPGRRALIRRYRAGVRRRRRAGPAGTGSPTSSGSRDGGLTSDSRR